MNARTGPRGELMILAGNRVTFTYPAGPWTSAITGRPCTAETSTYPDDDTARRNFYRLTTPPTSTPGD